MYSAKHSITEQIEKARAAELASRRPEGAAIVGNEALDQDRPRPACLVGNLLEYENILRETRGCLFEVLSALTGMGGEVARTSTTDPPKPVNVDAITHRLENLFAEVSGMAGEIRRLIGG